ncbi:hypothetical protein SCUCBS95973_002342 [Sporothrix curviconia]|uniref:Major facilitator superfamily (MFS) profile domain-containing protein n=1 Tax=Sporothrix curviconia TaxID=1260050 RepID=A0ABP0B6W8_9PEZI
MEAKPEQSEVDRPFITAHDGDTEPVTEAGGHLNSFFPQIDATKSSRPSFLKGLMTAIVEFGTIFGSLSCGYLADRYSRKRTIFFGSIGFMVGLVLQIAAQDYERCTSQRSSCRPPGWRGALLAMAGWSILVGTSISFWISYGTRFIKSSWCFRLPFAIQLIPALGLAAGTFLLPYSTRWLAAQDCHDEGLTVLCRLRGCSREQPDASTMAEWTEILIAVQLDRCASADKHGHVASGSLKWEFLRWQDLFSTRAMLRRFVVACGLFWFQQLEGIDALLYYGPSFFESLNYGATDQLNWSGIINCMNLAGGTTTNFTTDRLGRKKLLIAGAIIITSCHAVLAGIIGAYSSDWTDHQNAAKAGVAMLSAWGTFVFFGGCTFLSLFFVIFIAPLTKGVLLETMDIIFKDGVAEEDAKMRAAVTSELRAGNAGCVDIEEIE